MAWLSYKQAMYYVTLLLIIASVHGYYDKYSLIFGEDRFGANLTENFAYQRISWPANAASVLDGNRNPYYGNGSCVQVDSPTFGVQLANEIYVTSIAITARADPAWDFQRIIQIEVQTVDDKMTICSKVVMPTNGKTLFTTCAFPIKGLYVVLHDTTGHKLTFCELEVFGRPLDFYEHEENVALRKPSTQINAAMNYHASLAVDGIRAVEYIQNSCCHTEHADDAWWRVDLMESVFVYVVVMTNRLNFWQRMGSFDVRINENEGLSLHSVNCAGTQSLMSAETRPIFCFKPLKGRFVSVVSRLKATAINFCEISVHVKRLSAAYYTTADCVNENKLGMENGMIPNSHITASGEAGGHPATSGRLNYQGPGAKCWAASGPDPWIQVEFVSMVIVTKVLTQGRGSYGQWVKTYSVSYASANKVFVFYQESGITKIFDANWDSETVVRRSLVPPVKAQYIRLHPHLYHNHPSMRLELVGCFFSQVCVRQHKLGMENGIIPDAQITALDQHTNFYPYKARLNAPAVDDCWIAVGAESWIQVEFSNLVVITKILTQGRSIHNQWTKSYTLSYARENMVFTYYYEAGNIRTFNANWDSNTIVSNSLPSPILAKYVRLHPSDFSSYPALRMELVGCYYDQATNQPALIQEENKFQDDRFLASSFLDILHGPQNALLTDVPNAASWTPATNETGEYIQVDLGQLAAVSGIMFMLPSDTAYIDYAHLVLSYSHDSQVWKTLRDNNQRVKVFNITWCCDIFEKPVLTRHVRLTNIDHERIAGFRFQLYGLTDFKDMPAGMEESLIKDDQITSSNHPADPYPPHHARLNNMVGAWCANTNRPRLYLQVDFVNKFEVHGMATQGRMVDIMYYVTSYQLSHSMDSVIWKLYEENNQVKDFYGNADGISIQRHKLTPFVTLLLRVLPVTWEGSPCMRLEFFGRYIGVLRVYARAGDSNSGGPPAQIQINGKARCSFGNGYNVVVISHVTGELTSCHTSDHTTFTSTLQNLPEQSVIVIAAQNVTERPSDQALVMLEQIGAGKLRHAKDYDKWVLLGYKGDDTPDWITEKIANSDDPAVTVVTYLSLEEGKNHKKLLHQYFNWSEVGQERGYTLVNETVSTKCGTSANADCIDGLSLSLLLEEIPKRQIKPKPLFAKRFVFPHYSRGSDHTVIRDNFANFTTAQTYCLAIESHLPEIGDTYHNSFISQKIIEHVFHNGYLNTKLHPGLNTVYLNGLTEAIYTSWQSGEPTGNEQCIVHGRYRKWKNFPCSTGRFLICQKNILDETGLSPIGLENIILHYYYVSCSSFVGHGSNCQKAIFSQPFAWCSTEDDQQPYFQVDMRRLAPVCGVATKGQYSSNPRYPIAYTVKSSNDSTNWLYIKHTDGAIKIFRANDGRPDTVINRFDKVIASHLRIDMVKWAGASVCTKIELFLCKEELEKHVERMIKNIPVPKSITVITARSCADILLQGHKSSGVYLINPNNHGTIPAYCDQTTDGGGWTVIQRRHDGYEDFQRDWDDYKHGFGDLYHEHWLGNENILKLTRQHICDLKIILQAFDDSTLHIVYSSFTLGIEADKYRLYFDEHLGPGADGLGPHKEQSFKTINSTGYPSGYGGAWWYNGGNPSSNLNGVYRFSQVDNDVSTISWRPWFGYYRALKTTTMMIRRKYEMEGALGMINGHIKNFELHSNYDNSGAHVINFHAYEARLDNTFYWFSTFSGIKYFLHVDLPNQRAITHIAMQGRRCCNNWVKRFKLRMQKPSGYWIDYKEQGKVKIFEGNNEATLNDVNDIVSICLKESTEAKAMKIYPTDCQHYCSIRMELYSCEHCKCSASLGMSKGALADHRIRASSHISGSEPHKGLLHNTEHWQASVSQRNEFLEISITELFFFTFIETQGSPSQQCFITSYVLQYLDQNQQYQTYGGPHPVIFQGNVDGEMVVKNRIDKPFAGHALRLVAKTFHNSVCLRMEVYGCYQSENPAVWLKTSNVTAGGSSIIQGTFRYCEQSQCPGCIKSLCMRVFDKIYLVKKHFKYTCQYEDFEVTVDTPNKPGVYNVFMGDHDESNCDTLEKLGNERSVGTITITKYPSTCLDLLLTGHTESGLYAIDPDGQGLIKVYCDQNTYGGGWTVFQRRVDGTLSFDVEWSSYKGGFGDLEKNFWLGNDYIHRLSKTIQELLIEADSVNDDKKFFLYRTFQVSGEDLWYQREASDYHGDIDGCFNRASETNFTTKDRDNDLRTSGNCAVQWEGGFWFGNCWQCHVNAKYETMKFKNWDSNNMRNVELKIRDQYVVTCSERYCYYVIPEEKSWYEASEQCRLFHADILSVHNAEENAWIVDEIFGRSTLDQVHLGIKAGVSKWTDGSEYSFQNSANAEANGECGYLEKDKSWAFGNCHARKKVICKKGKYCFKEKCFVLGDTEATYDEGSTYCQDLGYKMVKISSAAENEYIRGILMESTSDYSWPDVFIGLRLDGASSFSWEDVSRDVYNDWVATPTYTTSQSCVKVAQNGWQEASCTGPAKPLCEKLSIESPKPLDCLELLMSGFTMSGYYEINPDNRGTIGVYCDQDKIGGGWTVLFKNHRIGSIFEQDWETYREGFGSPRDGDYWIGNEKIYRLTKEKQEALFDMNSGDHDMRLALYKTFQVESEVQDYQLHLSDHVPWMSSDGMSALDGAVFVAGTRDNGNGCFGTSKGGWWHGADCTQTFLTGKNEENDAATFSRWRSSATETKIITESEMKIRRKNVVTCSNRYCYYLSNEKKTWDGGVNICRKFNTDLVSIHDDTEQGVVLGIMTSLSLSEVYLGIGKNDMEKWSDGSTIEYHSLQITEIGDECVSLRNDGSWIVGSCQEKKHIICKRSAHCYHGDCYVFTPPGSFDDATERCDKLGWNLARVTNEGENEFIYAHAQYLAISNKYYIGMKKHEKLMTWVDGTSFRSYDALINNEPNGGINEQCLSYHYSVNWVDLGCTLNNPAVCEKGPIAGSCSEIAKFNPNSNGFHKLILSIKFRFKAICDFVSRDGPWTVIQKRARGWHQSDYVTRTWLQYKIGFGDSELSFWIGNRKLNLLTKRYPHRLKIVLHTEFGQTFEAIYDNFAVGDEAAGFPITFSSYSGNAGDSLTRHHGMKFSTFDNNNAGPSCNSSHAGGWWFADCLDSNLNGDFLEDSNFETKLFWRTLPYKIIMTEMKIQPQNIEQQYFRPQAVIRSEHGAELGLLFTDDSMQVQVTTDREKWLATTSRPPRGVPMTITWSQDSYLRLYYNGIVLHEAASTELTTYQHSTLYKPDESDPRPISLRETAVWNYALDPTAVANSFKTDNYTFENGLTPWEVDNVSTIYQWKLKENCISSIEDAPCVDATTRSSRGKFVYADCSYPAMFNDTTLFISRMFQPIYHCLSFWYHTTGEPSAHLNVYTSTNTSSEYNDTLWSMTDYGRGGNVWRYMEIDMTMNTSFKVVFQATRGPYSTCFIAIDDVTLQKNQCKRECPFPCEANERCNVTSLTCVYQGVYDLRWSLDDVTNIEEENDHVPAATVFNNIQQTSGVVDNAIKITNGHVILAELNRDCEKQYCFPKLTVSLWIRFSNFENYKHLLALFKPPYTLGFLVSEEPPEGLSFQIITVSQNCFHQSSTLPDIWYNVVLIRQMETDNPPYTKADDKTHVYIDGVKIPPGPCYDVAATDFDTLKVELKIFENSDMFFDDVRILFDVLSEYEIVKQYNMSAGLADEKHIQVKFELLTYTWTDELLDHNSQSYKSLSELIKTKLQTTFETTSKMKDVKVVGFIHGSVIADVNLFYDDISYKDLLLLEEALFVNNTIDDLPIHGIDINSSSIHNQPLLLDGFALDYYTIRVNWTHDDTTFNNGVFRGYRILYRETEHSSYTNYTEMVVENIDGEAFLTGLEMITNYTIRLVLYNTNGDGLISDPITVITEEGTVLSATNLSAICNSSTDIYVNWTSLPDSGANYTQLLGYIVFYWEENDAGVVWNITTTENSTYSYDQLKKWTSYCFNVTAYTAGGLGAFTDPLCVKTCEDVPEGPPLNLTIIAKTWSTLTIEWSPPDFIPGILRRYNLTIRNMNYTDDTLDFVSLNSSSGVTSYTFENLIGFTQYEINITGITVAHGPWASLLHLTDEGVPSISCNISVVDNTSTSLTMSWSDIPHMLRNGHIIGYGVLLWQETEGNSTALNETFSSTTFVNEFTGLEKYTVYCFSIYGITDVGKGPSSPVQCNRTYEDAPEMAPPSLNATNITEESFHVRWDQINASFIPGILRSYRVIYRIIDPGHDQSNRTVIISSQNTSLVLTGLSGLTNYEVMVEGFTVKYGPVATIIVQTKEGVPSAPPSNFNVSMLTSKTILLTWDEIPIPDRHGIIAGYTLTYEGEGTSGEKKTMEFDKNARTAFLFDLIPYTWYGISMMGYTSEGNESIGYYRFRTAEDIPLISPKDIKAQNFTSPTKILFTWLPLTTRELQGKLQGYRIKYQKISEADEMLRNRPETTVIDIFSPINTITLPALTTFSTYAVTIAAISGAGFGPDSPALYLATCRCFPVLTTNSWNYQPYTNITDHASYLGFMPYLLNMVTTDCCQVCLEHGNSTIDYYHDGEGNEGVKDKYISVVRNLTLKTDFSFPIFGFKGQEKYNKYYGYTAIVEAAGSVFLVLKPDYGAVQGSAFLQSLFGIIPFLSISVIFSILAGIMIWILERNTNSEEFHPSFSTGAPAGFWWAFITMTTVGYGDKTIRSNVGRIFSIFWILIGLVLSSLLISAITSAVTSATATEDSESTVMLFAAQVGVLQDSPEHRLALRRNAKPNTHVEYHSLAELQQALMNGEVSGILLDTFVADSRQDLFNHPRFMVKQVIDYSSSFGVVMGENATKLRKCFKSYWKEHSKMRTEFIDDNTDPLFMEQLDPGELVGETYSTETSNYQIALFTCLIMLGAFTFLGIVYELIRRKRNSAKVAPKVLSKKQLDDLKDDINASTTTIQKKLETLSAKHKRQNNTFLKYVKK